MQTERDRVVSTIDVDGFINRFGVDHPQVQTTLRQFPTLCYLLGEVTPEAQIHENRQPIHFLKSGSGMFGLKIPEDARRWRGIFNHIAGSTSDVYSLSVKLSQLTDEQRQQFADQGYDHSSFDKLNPELMRDFFFISHAGRRQADEFNWHGLRDSAHPSGDSYQNTSGLLEAYHADPFFIETESLDNPDYLVAQAGDRKILPQIQDTIGSYCDWRYGQSLVTLKERFIGMRESKRLPEDVLDVLEQCGTHFEQTLRKIFGEGFYEGIITHLPYAWETQLRKAYCASSGILPKETFPEYFERFPEELAK